MSLEKLKMKMNILLTILKKYTKRTLIKQNIYLKHKRSIFLLFNNHRINLSFKTFYISNRLFFNYGNIIFNSQNITFGIVSTILV